MPNPRNSTNLTLSEETYNRLRHLKETRGWSFNQTVEALCDLELKNNYINKVSEFSLITETTSRLFRVQFKKDNMVIEYYNPNTGYDRKIKNWDLDDTKVVNAFFEFIGEPYARCMLEHLPLAIEFELFVIQRIS